MFDVIMTFYILAMLGLGILFIWHILGMNLVKFICLILMGIFITNELSSPPRKSKPNHSIGITFNERFSSIVGQLDR